MQLKRLGEKEKYIRLMLSLTPHRHNSDTSYAFSLYPFYIFSDSKKKKKETEDQRTYVTWLCSYGRQETHIFLPYLAGYANQKGSLQLPQNQFRKSMQVNYITRLVDTL